MSDLSRPLALGVILIFLIVVFLSFARQENLRGDCFKILENPTVPLEVKIKLMEGHCK